MVAAHCAHLPSHCFQCCQCWGFATCIIRTDQAENSAREAFIITAFDHKRLLWPTNSQNFPLTPFRDRFSLQNQFRADSDYPKAPGSDFPEEYSYFQTRLVYSLSLTNYMSSLSLANYNIGSVRFLD